MKQNLALRALYMAMAIRWPPTGRSHHKDRARNSALTPSIRGKGNCCHSSAVERFFKSLKVELVWRCNWQNRCEVDVPLFEYIYRSYNPRRKHSAVGWKSPVVLERKAP
jgi:transposase InsO family protein